MSTDSKQSTPDPELLHALVEEIPSMVAYWDSALRCRFANRAYEKWFGTSPESLIGRHISELLGPIYARNLPYIEGALRGERQEFERELPDPAGGPPRHSLANYIPDVVDGVVRGFFVLVTDISAIKRAQLALAESEERFRLTIDEAPIGMALVALDGRFIRVNRALCDIVGYTAEELTGLTFQAITHPEDLDKDLELAARLSRGEIPRYQLEKRYIRKDGTVVDIMLSGSVLRGRDGAPVHFIAQIEDITERKRIEDERRARETERERLAAELQARRLWLEAVLENVPVGVILFDSGGHVSVNRRTEELFGMKISPEGGSAQYSRLILFPDGTPVSRDELVSSRVLRTGETVLGAEFLVQRPDGTRFPILGSAAPIRGDGGTVIGAIGVFQDVSERMQAEEAIRLRERLLSGIFEILPVGLWITDEGGKVLRSNPAAIRIWGGHAQSSADFQRAKGWWADTNEPVSAEEWPLARALRGQQVIDSVMRIRSFDGSQKTIVNSALPLFESSGKLAGAIVVNQDISELKRTEDSLRRAMRSRDDVLGIVAHDLRNPLNGILLQTQLLERRRREGTEQADQKATETIRRQASRMSRLIQDLLDVARIESGALSVVRGRVEVQPLLREVLDAQEPSAAASSIRLRLELEERPADVWGDRERLVQIFENLIGNALKFTPSGGVVSLGATSSGSETVFWVADTGPGIEPEVVQHLFDRFWQARHADKRGAGLGLAIVKGIVEAHGGRTWVESALGVGTKVFFSVPRA